MDDLQSAYIKLTPIERAIADWQMSWMVKRLPHQVPPKSQDWTIWLLLAGRGAGKALALDTPLPTPDGWTTMGDVKSGDTLFDENGRPCRVLESHPVMVGRPCYRVTFSDGSEVIADGGHLWRTETRRARKAAKRCTGTGDYRKPQCRPAPQRDIFTTEDIHASLMDGREINHAVRLCEPLELPEQKMPIHPYVLGVWLGDGSSACGEITTADPEVIDEMIRCGETIGKCRETGNASKTYTISPGAALTIQGKRDFQCNEASLTSRLRALGVLRDKHVPTVYLRASLDQRLALLQGLMDTDGYISARGIAEFCTTKRPLADAVFDLVSGLGMKATLREGRATLNGRDCGPKYRVNFTPYMPIFRLSRKLTRVKSGSGAQADRQRRRYIVAVQPIDSVPVRCVTVDSPSRLYLCGRTMIPTHNTRTAAEVLGAWATLRPGTRWLVSAPTYGDLTGVCFEGESGLINCIPPELIETYNRSEVEIKMINGSTIKGITAEKPERFRGPQFHGGWLDELAAWQRADEAFDLLMFGMRLGDRPRLICTTTPKPNTIIRNLLAREGKDVIVTRASTYENLANLAPTFRDQILRYEGTTIGRQEIHAEVISPEEMGVIRRSWIKLWPHDRQLPELEFIVMSLDTAFTEDTGSTVKGDPDYSACAVWGVFSMGKERRDIILLDCWQDRLGFPDLIKRVKAEMKAVYAPRERAIMKPMFGPSYTEDSGRKPDLLLIEDKGSGISLRQVLGKEGIMSAPYNPGRARKLDRLHAISPLFAAGRVWVPESTKMPGQAISWAQTMIEQLCTFSGEGSIPHDDMMDAGVQGLRYLSDRDMIRVTRPEAPEPRAYDDRPKGNPYAA